MDNLDLISREPEALPIPGDGFRQSTIGLEIRRHAERWPDHAAVMSSNFAPVSYRKLQFLVDQVRADLRQNGLNRSARIAIAITNGPHAALVIVAVACSAVSIPLDPRQTPREIEMRFAALRPDALLLMKGSDFRRAPGR